MGKKSKQNTFDIADFIQKQDLEEQITMDDIQSEEEIAESEPEQEVEMNSEDELELKAYLESQEPEIKYYKNEKEAMVERLDDIELNIDWIETMAITSEPLGEVDHNDDLKRELAFYSQALFAANQAREKCKELKVPFSRPDDYFAEMLKTDQHMEKIRLKLLEESKNIQKSEQAKKQRELKKFGKKIQTEKVLERQKTKKESLEKIKKMRKKGMGEKDDFDIDVQNDEKPNFKRSGKNKKYGFGGGKRNSKSNTRESTDDLSSFSIKKMKSKANGKANGGRVGKKSFGKRK